jgi:hypothetical protein
LPLSKTELAVSELAELLVGVGSHWFAAPQEAGESRRLARLLLPRYQIGITIAGLQARL